MKNETEAVNKVIFVLQQKRVKELELINEHLHSTYESLRPINFIKSTVKEISSSSEIKKNFLGVVVGIGTGFLLKKLLVGNSRDPALIMVGSVLEFAVVSVVPKQTEIIKSTGKKMLYRYLKNRKIQNNNVKKLELQNH